ncbi:hypothetical protein NIES25_23770 [Nostoc linckia NIES-25]|nr:hypothetical protein NIES25_23770 [Nostoc linckia NIES-25]
MVCVSMHRFFQAFINHSLMVNRPGCKGTAVLIGVNLSSNAYSIGILPHPQPLPLARGGEVLRQQNRGEVTRILMVSE